MYANAASVRCIITTPPRMFIILDLMFYCLLRLVVMAHLIHKLKQKGLSSSV